MTPPEGFKQWLQSLSKDLAEEPQRNSSACFYTSLLSRLCPQPECLPKTSQVAMLRPHEGWPNPVPAQTDPTDSSDGGPCSGFWMGLGSEEGMGAKEATALQSNISLPSSNRASIMLASRPAVSARLRVNFYLLRLMVALRLLLLYVCRL